jgi:16S rRNA (guanine527-N7)-methyltransferase
VPSDERVPARLRELAAEHELDPGAPAHLARLLELLAADPHAPSAVREPREAVELHVADSLAGLAVPALRAAARIADLGAGAGFPGLPLAIALPRARVTLVESNRRKADFLARGIAVAGIANAEVAAERAESWRAGREACDAVVARALASLPVLVEYAAPLLREGGTLVAWKGARAEAEARDGAAAAARLGLRAASVHAVAPFPGVRDRRLYVYVKHAPTPAGYPRRPGVAARRPLRGSDRPRR